MTLSPYSGQTVLVTGGTGTIGSEIVRQLIQQGAEVIRVLSRDETKQAHLKAQLNHEPGVRFLIGDIRDLERLRTALQGVHTVFHTAALKHVPACEYNPFEAVQTNIVGTQLLVQACRDAGVRRLVYISTDKAVNPSSTMGATKLVAENLIRASQEWNSELTLSTVRFGNVLGSRGSLLPMLADQIREHGEIQLTSTSMTRFMMTTLDAVRLVLEAGASSRGGELWILKMPALRVADLARVFAEEFCERSGADFRSIETVEIGVRPGEKMHEELVTVEEWQRLETRDDFYVVEPNFRQPGPIRSDRELPRELSSQTAPLLDDQGIRELLARSSYFGPVREGVLSE